MKSIKNRTKSSLMNFMVSGLSKIFLLVLSFIARSIFIKYLSIEYLGVNGLFSNILMILSLAELGIGNAIVLHMYKPIKNNNTEKIKTLLKFYKTTYTKIGILVLIVGLVIIPFLGLIIKDTPNIVEDIRLIYILFLTNTVVSYFVVYRKSILSGHQEEYIITLVTNVVYIIQTSLQIVFLIFTKNFVVFLLLQILCTLGSNLLISFLASRRYPFIKEKNVEEFSNEEKKEINEDIKALAISKISGVVMNGTDNILISSLFDLARVGLVSNYLLVVNSINNIVWASLSSITSSIGNLNSSENIIKIKALFGEIFLASFSIYTFVCVCLFCLLNPLILVWLGQDFLLNNLTTFSIILPIFISGMNFSAYTFRTTMGYVKQVKYVYLLSAILNIGLSIILGKLIGVSGIFFATAISKLLTSEIADGYYVYKHGFKISPFHYYKKYIIHFLLFIFILINCYLISNLITLDGVLGLLVKTSIVVPLSIFLLFVFKARTNEFRTLKNRIFKPRPSKKNI